MTCGVEADSLFSLDDSLYGTGFHLLAGEQYGVSERPGNELTGEIQRGLGCSIVSVRYNCPMQKRTVDLKM